MSLQLFCLQESAKTKRAEKLRLLAFAAFALKAQSNKLFSKLLSLNYRYSQKREEFAPNLSFCDAKHHARSARLRALLTGKAQYSSTQELFIAEHSRSCSCQEALPKTHESS